MPTYPIAPPAPGAMLSRAANYVRATWWPARYPASGIPSVPNTEVGLRGAAMVAHALTTADHLGAWDSSVDAVVARGQAAKLIAAVARQHKANTSGGWGGGWQTALWASILAEAALLGWTTCIPNQTERDNVIRMVSYEADARLAVAPEVWCAPDGRELRPGDSAAEENAWNSTVCVLASAMLADHPHTELWLRHGVSLAINSFSIRGDCSSALTVNGLPLSSWCQTGFNVQPNGLVVNHNRVNPDYTSTMWTNLHSAVLLTILGRPAPIGLSWGAYRSWRALSVSDMGQGPAYTEGTPLITFPPNAPSDWGVRRPATYYAADAHIRWLGLDASGSAPYWESLHGNDLGWMQARPTSPTHPLGAVYDSSYVNPPEDSYGAREEWAAHHMATAALAREYGRSVQWYDAQLL